MYFAYTTKQDVRIYTKAGTKSSNDFRVLYKEPDKRVRTPKHIHLITELYMKLAYDKETTLRMRNYILTVINRVCPINNYHELTLQVYRPGDETLFQNLNAVGEYDVEFMLVVTELIAIQEATNYPEGSLTRKLYEDFGIKDIFQVINTATLRKIS